MTKAQEIKALKKEIRKLNARIETFKFQQSKKQESVEAYEKAIGMMAGHAQRSIQKSVELQQENAFLLEVVS
jgi:hypothetical protein